MATKQKRKRVVLSIETKLEILDSLTKGVSPTKLAEQYELESRQ